MLNTLYIYFHLNSAQLKYDNLRIIRLKNLYEYNYLHPQDLQMYQQTQNLLLVIVIFHQLVFQLHNELSHLEANNRYYF